MSKTKKKPAESNINTIFRSAAKFIFDIITWFFRTLREAHTKGITGLLCWVVAIYLAVAFISYIMSWGEDQSYAINTTLRQTIIDSDTTTQNAMGRMGSYVSHWIFYEGFGIASFIIVILLWLTGNYWLFKNQTVNLPKAYRQGILSLFLFSVMLSYFFTYSSNGFPFGGSVGQYINEWLQGFIGSFGTFLALLCLFAIWLVMILEIPIDNLVVYARGFSWQKAQDSLRRIWQQAIPVQETNPIEHTQTTQSPTRQTNTNRSTNTNNTTTNTFNPLPPLPAEQDLPDKGEQQDLFKPPIRSIPLSTNNNPPKKSTNQNDKDNFHINQPYQEPLATYDTVETDVEEETFYSENVANANPR
ncbi:MAG TPA: DNA translocase FtsK 4TM domain-containing protein, partial [Chitinophagales bacterium]|nr:DNA translocase FtsK 4TM domain-containing protein [Chitinophagales bacterium]